MNRDILDIIIPVSVAVLSGLALRAFEKKINKKQNDVEFFESKLALIVRMNDETISLSEKKIARLRKKNERLEKQVKELQKENKQK